MCVGGGGSLSSSIFFCTMSIVLGIKELVYDVHRIF